MRGKEGPKADTRERLKERRGIAGAGAQIEGEALAQVTAVTGKGKQEKAQVKALVKSVTGKMKPGAPAQMGTERRKNTERAMETSAVK